MASPLQRLPLASMKRRRVRAAFTLVETALALGIAAFALVPLMGLLPLGLQSMRTTIDNTVTTQIVQRLVNEAQQTDFDVLAKADYYFSDQGILVNVSDTSKVYTVNVTVNKQTSIPSDDSTGGTPSSNLATLTLQITQNGANKRTVSAFVARTAASSTAASGTSSLRPAP